MTKPFTDSESNKALKAFEIISNYCRTRDDNCGDCVFAADIDGSCLFQDSLWMGENRMGSITKSEILERATELI